MFGLAGTPPRAQRHPMSQATAAVEDKTQPQCETLNVAHAHWQSEPFLLITVICYFSRGGRSTQQCWGRYFDSTALRAANSFTLEEAELQQSFPRETFSLVS